MLSKKPGPPVPPRPINTGAAHSLSKSQSTSTMKMPTPHGRTVIYKSPSYDLMKSKQQIVEDEDDGKDAEQHESSPVTTKTRVATPPRTPSFAPADDVIGGGVCCGNNKIIIVNNNNVISVNNSGSGIGGCDPNELNVKLSESAGDNNSHRLAIVQNASPVARPRQNAPSKKLQRPQPNNENHYDESRSIVVSAAANDENVKTTLIETAAKASTTTTASKDVVMVTALKDHQQLNHHTVIDNNHHNNNSNNNNSTIYHSNGATDNANRIEIKTSHMEMKNNLKNSTAVFSSTVAEKLFTEIVINSHLAEEQQQPISRPQYQTKLEHCIQVRTPSPPTPTVYRSAPSPVSMVDTTAHGIEASGTAEKKVTFHELLISELTEMHKDDTMSTMPVVRPKNSRSRRYSSSCSADSSPNGTQRSRIRTSDWVEVGDNGKEVLLTSCQISLEDSGLEDEERLDELSSGVGDSWDSVKDNDDR